MHFVVVEEIQFRYFINYVQFSKYCTKVYSIDIDPKKIALTRSNSKVYQCSDNITFICEDFLKIESYNIKVNLY